jgi:UDP-N-acetylglucosamine 3-dehydrogenase
MTPRVLLIGLGMMGTNHARVLGDLDTVDWVGVADVDEVAVHRVTRGRALRGYTDYREALAAERPDAAIVAVPTRLHAEVAGYALEQGVHVLVEKPIAASVAEGEALRALAEKRGLLLSVGHVERFNPALIELKRRLDVGELGQVFHLHARRLGPFAQRIEDVGVAVDLATHDLDLMCHLVDSFPERLHSAIARRVHSQHEDLVSALLWFPNGVIGQLEASWLTPTKVRELLVTGERGMFALNYLTQELWFYENSEACTDWTRLAELTGVSEGSVTRLPIHRQEPLRLELAAFVAAVAEGGRPPVPAVAALDSLRLAQELVAAAPRPPPTSG